MTARALLCLLVLSLSACGGDKDSPPTPTDPDAGMAFPDGGPYPPQPAACNPALQIGCAPNEKCAAISAGTGTPVTRCVADGTVLPGQSCAAGANGADNCVAGYHCYESVCTQICGQQSTPFRCNAQGGTCVRLASAFTDVVQDRIGICRESCNPLAPDCSNPNHGCYLDLNTGVASCARIPSQSQTQTQDEVCYGPATGTCYQNGCAAGFGAHLPTSFASPEIERCAQYCSPVNTTVASPGGAAGNPAGETCPAGYQCRFIRSFLRASNVPVGLGMCVSVAAWGTCTTCDPSTPNSYTQTCLAQNARGCIANPPL